MEDEPLANSRSHACVEVLKDGTAVTLRAVRRDDGPNIREAFHNLEPETVYTRFFGYRADVSDTELKRITEVDFERDVALLVTIRSGAKEIVVGGARAVSERSESLRDSRIT